MEQEGKAAMYDPHQLDEWGRTPEVAYISSVYGRTISIASKESSDSLVSMDSEASTPDSDSSFYSCENDRIRDSFFRMEAAVIAKWGIKVFIDPSVGRYLTPSIIIPKGEVGMVLPPYKILPLEDVHNPDEANSVMQVRDSFYGDGGLGSLYSSSITKHSYDNFLNHSCDPNMTVKVLSDFTVHMVALRDIFPGEILSWHYEQTEEDLIGNGADFHCACAAPNCTGYMKGSMYRHEPLPKPATRVAIIGAGSRGVESIAAFKSRHDEVEIVAFDCLNQIGCKHIESIPIPQTKICDFQTGHAQYLRLCSKVEAVQYSVQTEQFVVTIRDLRASLTYVETFQYVIVATSNSHIQFDFCPESKLLPNLLTFLGHSLIPYPILSQLLARPVSIIDSKEEDMRDCRFDTGPEHCFSSEPPSPKDSYEHSVPRDLFYASKALLNLQPVVRKNFEPEPAVQNIFPVDDLDTFSPSGCLSV